MQAREDEALRDCCTRLDAAVLPFARKLTCTEGGYKSLAKAQKEGYDPLVRQKISLDDNGKTPVKFYDENKNMIGLATLANPVLKEEDEDFSFKIKLDI